MHNTTVKSILKTAVVLSGLVLLAVFVIIALLPWMDRWGATEDELPASFSGDDNINTTYFDLRVTGANDFSSTVLHGEGYNVVQDGGLWEQNLPAGTYQVVLTSHQSPGMASVYLKTR